MEDTICPRCKTTKFQNPSLKMMVNVCGHALCESCVDLLFLKGSGACPDCRIPLRRINFRIQLFDDVVVEKEVDIRKRVLRDFNKKEEDFTTLREYNDYLEDIETIIYNLANNIEVVETNKKIEEYKKNNKEQIAKNKGKLSKEEFELEELLEIEKQHEQMRRNEIQFEEIEAKKKKIREKEALIDELMFSNANAKNILETFAQTTKEQHEIGMKQAPAKPTQFSTGIQIGRQSHNTFLPVPIDEGPLYVYKPTAIETNGPPITLEEDFIKLDYSLHVRKETEQERAGGFMSTIPCRRALLDAFCGLYHIKKAVS